MYRRLVIALLAVVSLAGFTAPADAQIVIDNRELEETRIAALFGMIGGGTRAFQVKALDGSFQIDRNETVDVDPASAIKALHHLTAMREVQAGRDWLWYSNVPIYGTNPDGCPGAMDPWQGTVTLDAALRMMMRTSDNRATDSVRLRYTQERLNAVAREIGLSVTRLDALIGCNYYGTGRRNHTTAAELVKLYEDVQAGRTLNGTFREEFFARMNQLTLEPAFRTIVEQEGIVLGVSAAERDQLWRGIVHISKAGSYHLWTGTRTVYTDTVAGIVKIPFQNPGGTVRTRSYAWAEMVVEALLDHDGGFNKVSKELFRIPIRQALRSFRAN